MAKIKCPNCETKYKGKFCPDCGSPAPEDIPKKKKRTLPIIIAIVFVIALLSCMGGGDETEDFHEVSVQSESSIETVLPEDNNTPSEPLVEDAPIEEPAQETAPVPEKEFYSVGDEVMDGKTRMVYMASGEYIEENEFSQPPDGHKYIYLLFYAENTASDFQTYVSSFEFECYADGYAVDSYYPLEGELGATLSPGRSTVGLVCFTVPVDASKLEIEYTSNYFTSEKIRFSYDGDQYSGFVPPTTTSASEDAHAVGSVVESSVLRINYLSCEEYISDNMFVQPKDGYQYISCEYEFENIGNSDQYIYSGDFTCYADGMACDATYIRDDDVSATLSAGRKTKGTVTFEVPIDAQTVEAEYLSNYWTSSRVVFTIR